MPDNHLLNVQNSNQSFKFAFITCLIVSIAISIVSITNQSLWIDEAATAWLASHPTFAGLIDTQINTSYGETQKLFHVWYIWAWAKVFGISEYSLRFSNLPFLFIFLLTVQWGAKTLFKNRWLWVLAALNPFVWYYMNEARPYMGVIAFSSLAVVSFLIYVLEPTYKPRLMPWLCLFGLFIATGMIMLGAFIIPCFFIALGWAYKWDWVKWKIFLKDWLWPILIFLPFFLALGGWFVWVTLYQGAGAGIIETPSFLNSLFGLYEFLGFLGLGPPRNLLRSEPSLHTFFQSGYIVTFITGVTCLIIVSVGIIMNIREKGLSKRISLLIIMFLVGVLSFHFVAYFFHFRYWGRHMAQFFPLFILIIIAALSHITYCYRRINLRHFAIWTLAAIWLLSSSRLAFLSDYGKDDYRSAVSHVTSSVRNGGTILWAGDTIGASYYGLSCTNDPLPKVFWPTPFIAIRTGNWNKNQINYTLSNNTLPIVIAISKSDVFDPNHTIENLLKERNAKLIATPNTFRVYSLSEK
jgi:hypothetical protein